MNKWHLYWDRMQTLDGTLCVKVSHTNQYRWIRDSFRAISRLGDGVFWYTLMIGILLVNKEQGLLPFFHMALAGSTGTLVYKWLKNKTLRPRPYQVRQDVWLAGRALDHFSFPSGHTLHAVVFGMIAIHYYPVLLVLVLPFMILVAMSRVILGLHYPSDVLAGAAIGYFLVQISYAFLNLIV